MPGLILNGGAAFRRLPAGVPTLFRKSATSDAGDEVVAEIERARVVATRPSPRRSSASSESDRFGSDPDALRRPGGACTPSSGSSSLARARWTAAGSLVRRGRLLLCTGGVLWEGLWRRASLASRFVVLAEDSQ